MRVITKMTEKYECIYSFRVFGENERNGKCGQVSNLISPVVFCFPGGFFGIFVFVFCKVVFFMHRH